MSIKLFGEFIAEAWFDTRRSGLNSSQTYEIFKNPSASEMSKEFDLRVGARAIVKGANILVWPIYADLHAKVAKVYGWTDYLSLVLRNKGNKNVVFLSTDFDRGYPHQELVNIKHKLENNKNLKKAMGGKVLIYKSGGVPINEEI